MLHLPVTYVQEICCDATSLVMPEQVSFSYRSSFHNAHGRVHVDFSVNVKGVPVAYFGIWRFRVNFWLLKEVDAISYVDGFEYYKSGFRIALTAAEKFVAEKYNARSVMPTITDEILWEKYEGFRDKKD